MVLIRVALRGKVGTVASNYRFLSDIPKCFDQMIPKVSFISAYFL